MSRDCESIYLCTLLNTPSVKIVNFFVVYIKAMLIVTIVYKVNIYTSTNYCYMLSTYYF